MALENTVLKLNKELTAKNILGPTSSKAVTQLGNHAQSTTLESNLSSIATHPTMSYDKAIEMLKSYKGRGFSFLDQNIQVVINGKTVDGKWLGGGGSKCAYRINLNEEDICMLLPHGNWKGALNEPFNTLQLKKMGLLTNDYCKIVPVEIDGKAFPAILTKPYDKHTFKIFDRKNPNDIIDRYIDSDKLNDETIVHFMEDLIKDCKIMAKNKICLGSDSYNIALVNGKPRLYLNDLPYEPGEMISNSSYEDILQWNLEQSIDALGASFSMKMSSKHPTIKKLGSIDYIDSLVERILASDK